MNLAALVDAHKGDLSFLVRDRDYAAKMVKRMLALEARDTCRLQLDNIHIARRRGDRHREALAIRDFRQTYATYRQNWGKK